MINKDSYIVITANNDKDFEYLHCYKQRTTNTYLQVYQDSNGRENGWMKITENTPELWRYATTKEIEQYNFLNKPYDIRETNPDYLKTQLMKDLDILEKQWKSK